MGTRESVIAAQKKFDDAELHGDRNALEAMIHEDFQSIGPLGYLLDRRAWIDRHERFKYHELQVSDMDARLFGDAAIVRSIQRNHADSAGHEVRVATRVSQTWVSADGDWQLAGIQFSSLPDE